MSKTNLLAAINEQPSAETTAFADRILDGLAVGRTYAKTCVLAEWLSGGNRCEAGFRAAGQLFFISLAVTAPDGTSYEQSMTLRDLDADLLKPEYQGASIFALLKCWPSSSR